jgi:hypothetical protein
LTDVHESSLAWGDYDNDGDLDLALAGSADDAGRVSGIYRNNGGTFNSAPAAPTGLATAPGLKAIAGSPEFTNGNATVRAPFSALTGTQLTFTNADTVVTGADSTFAADGVAAGDLVRLDSDGDSWYEVETVDGETQLTLVEEYQGSGAPGTGSVIKAAGRTFFASQVVVGGFVRLDADGTWVEVSTVDSDTQLTLAAPYAGAGGSGASSVKTVRFGWGAPAVADETPDAGLSYNLRVGTTPGGNEVASGMADATGLRRLPARGAIQPGMSTSEWTLTLPAGTYYWSVQAIDTGLMGGEWAAEETVTVP